MELFTTEYLYSESVFHYEIGWYGKSRKKKARDE